MTATRRWLLVSVMAAVCAPLATTGSVLGDEAALRRMHEDFVDAFVNSQGFGKTRVTPMMVRMRHYQFEGIGGSGRCVHDVELIGIAWHDPPVVYPANFMGFQHEGGDAGLRLPVMPARSLQAWERDAVAALGTGQEIVRHALPGGERAMGAIRARRDCLTCHTRSREGDVLGALSYGLGHLVVPAQASDPRSCRP
jgi:hypothetical protein